MSTCTESRIEIVHRDPRSQPIRWSERVAQRTNINPRKTVTKWLTLRTVANPRTAIMLEDLHAVYLGDFSSVLGNHQLLEEDELLIVVTKANERVIVADDEGARVLVGLNWIPSKETETTAKGKGKAVEPGEVRGMKRRRSHRPEDAGDNEWHLQPVANQIDTEKARKDSMFDAASVDPDGKYRAWFGEVLVEDDTCEVGYGEIWLAFNCKFGCDNTDPFAFDGTQPVPIDQLWHLLSDCFAHLKAREHKSVYHAHHLRWSKLRHGVTRSVSLHGAKAGFPEHLRREAHELLYLKTKARVRAWQYMYFQEVKNVSISLYSVWCMYCIAFSRSSNTHRIATMAQFLRTLREQFKGLQAVKVSEKHIVLLNLGTRKDGPRPRDVVAMERLRAFQRLRIEEPTGPRNLFNQKLLEDPMLALPNPRRWRKHGPRAKAELENGEQHNDEQNDNDKQKVRKNKLVDGASAPGPFLQRLYRRGQGLSLGDEEPGFPGVSAKLEQKRMKRKIAVYQNACLKMVDPDPAKRPSQQEYDRIANEVLEVFPVEQFEEVFKAQCGGNPSLGECGAGNLAA